MPFSLHKWGFSQDIVGKNLSLRMERWAENAYIS